MVSHGVGVDFAAERLGCVGEPVAGLFIRVGEGEAAHAYFGGTSWSGLDIVYFKDEFCAGRGLKITSDPVLKYMKHSENNILSPSFSRSPLRC